MHRSGEYGNTAFWRSGKVGLWPGFLLPGEGNGFQFLFVSPNKIDGGGTALAVQWLRIIHFPVQWRVGSQCRGTEITHGGGGGP